MDLLTKRELKEIRRSYRQERPRRPPRFRMKTVLVLFLLLSLAMASCVTVYRQVLAPTLSAKQVAALRQGMTRAQVTRLLGKPTDTHWAFAWGYSVTWTYWRIGSWRSHQLYFDQNSKLDSVTYCDSFGTGEEVGVELQALQTH